MLSGSLSTQIVELQDISGTLSNLSGSLASSTTYVQSLTGVLSANGSVAKHISVSVGGVLAFTEGGTVSTGEAFFQSLAGSVGFNGSVATSYTEGLAVKGLYKLGQGIR
ncbi:MAG: hypothetical protein KGY38_06440 [Desulfobacterales bacterium]|nr:hypothetical protein [Desulfobacterales bacterium]